MEKRKKRKVEINNKNNIPSSIKSASIKKRELQYCNNNNYNNVNNNNNDGDVNNNNVKHITIQSNIRTEFFFEKGWWVFLMVNLSHKATKATQIKIHSSPELEMLRINTDGNKIQNKWAILMRVGRFTTKKNAKTFFMQWNKKSRGLCSRITNGISLVKKCYKDDKINVWMTTRTKDDMLLFYERDRLWLEFGLIKTQQRLQKQNVLQLNNVFSSSLLKSNFSNNDNDNDSREEKENQDGKYEKNSCDEDDDDEEDVDIDDKSNRSMILPMVGGNTIYKYDTITKETHPLLFSLQRKESHSDNNCKDLANIEHHHKFNNLCNCFKNTFSCTSVNNNNNNNNNAYKEDI